LTGGAGKIIGKYKFTFDNGSNRNADNTAVRAQLNDLSLAVSKSNNVLVTSPEIYIDGTATKVAADGTSNCNIAGTSCAITWTGNALNALADSGLVDGQVTLIVVGTVSTTSSEYLQTNIADLTSDISFNGYSGPGTDITDMLLDYTEVVGGTLSN
jgi:hypothetical protein